jgi:uncharacterized membrane protein
MIEFQSAEPIHTFSPSERWYLLGTVTAMAAIGMRRQRAASLCLAAAAGSFAYRGLVGHWPPLPMPPGARGLERGDTRVALAGNRGSHVYESVRLEAPVADVYRFWRHLENLPRFMSNLESVTVTSRGRSHWIAKGPGGVSVEWHAEVINEVENQVIGWRSLLGGDVSTAGSVNFDAVRDGRETQVTVHLQYAPPAGRVGSLVASLFGRAPSQTIREDLRRFKQLIEAGEIPRVAAAADGRAQ